MRAGATAMVLALLLAACGSSPPTRFYTLAVVPPGQSVRQAQGKPLQVERVLLPGDLDRASFVTRLDANRLAVSDQDRWAAPLDGMIQRVLAADLAQRLPPGMVLMPGDPAPRGGARGVSVNVRQFIGDAAGDVVLDVDWTLLAGDPAMPVLRRHATISAAAGSGQAGPIAAAMGRALGELSDRIAAAIR